MVRVYGLSGCGPCEVAKLYMKQKGLEFEFVDISTSEAARQKVQELVGSPNAGVVLEVNGEVEAIKGLSIPRLDAWYRQHQAQIEGSSVT